MKITGCQIKRYENTDITLETNTSWLLQIYAER